MPFLTPETRHKITPKNPCKFVRDGNRIAFSGSSSFHFQIARNHDLGEVVPSFNDNCLLVDDAGSVIHGESGKLVFFGTTLGCKIRGDARRARSETKDIASAILQQEVTAF